MILLIAGASGCGKSEISYPLARRLGLSVLEIDDLVTALKAVTSPEQLPALHRWDTDPTVRTWSADQIVAHTLTVIDALCPAVDAVIADHLDFHRPVIIEGDYLHLAAPARPGVRTILIHEPDPDQYLHNFAAREPTAGPQHLRAEVSAALDAHLTAQAREHDVPVVPARPWPTAIDRTAAALGL